MTEIDVWNKFPDKEPSYYLKVLVRVRTDEGVKYWEDKWIGHWQKTIDSCVTHWMYINFMCPECGQEA